MRTIVICCTSLQNWVDLKMKFHLDKWKFFNYKLSIKTTSEFEYFLDGTKLDYTNNEKDLGVQVVPFLRWNFQHKNY